MNEVLDCLGVQSITAPAISAMGFAVLPDCPCSVAIQNRRAGLKTLDSVSMKSPQKIEARGLTTGPARIHQGGAQ
jgi:hypothetical protein